MDSRTLKQLLALLLFLFGGKVVIHGQYTTTDLIYGNTIYQRNLGGQLNTFDQYTFGRPIQYLGMGFSGMVKVDRRYDLSGTFQWVKYLPQVFRINDSLNGKLTGFTIGLTAGHDFFPRAKAIDFILSGGLNLGKMKLIQEQFHYLAYTNNTLHLKNMLICPKVSVMTKFYLRSFCITFNAEYMYDISSTTWKEKLLSLGKPHSVAVAGFRQTGYSLSVHVGWSVPMSSNNTTTTAYSPDPNAAEPIEEDEEW